ncbi:MAG TPA: flagellar motor switch protein FliG [Bryobacteraceae bacterium]|nr:flagellar motor switch protein FliG [Bryobacteraceae bacterium]
MNVLENAGPKISGRHKAAILLVALGEKLGSEVLKRLNDDEVKIVSKAIASLDQVTPNQAESVLQEFHQAVSQTSGRGGTDFAKRVLVNAFGPAAAQRLSEYLPKAGNQRIESLQKADPQQLSRFVEGEHPQTIALILSHLPADRAASLMLNLSAPLRAEVVVRVAQLDRVSPDVVSRIHDVISEKLKSLGELRVESQGGPRAAADILNRLDSTASEEILETMSTDEQSLADVIRNFMFTFEDIVMLDVNAMKEVVAKVDRKLLTVALKGTSEQVMQHFLQCMSQRGGEMLREDMEATGPLKIKDVEAAQKQVLAVVHQLETDGTISLRGGAGDQYVV